MPELSTATQPENMSQMFSAISHRYDLLNHLFSFGLDRYWRRRLVEESGLVARGRVLDLCCGTADIALEFTANTDADVVGIDISEGMLLVAHGKIQQANLQDRISLLTGDAMEPPVSGPFDVISLGFGLRNLPDRQLALDNIYSKLAPEGRVLILEFAPADNVFLKALYRIHLHLMIPLIGGIVSGNMRAYRYLAESIEAFIPPTEIKSMMEKAGFQSIRTIPLFSRVAYIYVGYRQ